MTRRIAAAYIRRSVVRADSPGDASREAQLAAVRGLCGEDVTVFEDWGISGTAKNTQRRTGYLALRREIEAGRVASVCAYSLSRLGRSTRELLDFVDLCQRHDVTIRTKVDGLDTSSATGRAMLTVMGAFSQLEAELAEERGRAAREAEEARYASKGLRRPHSRPVYGLRTVKDDEGLRRVEQDDERLQPVLDAFREGGSLLKAAALLTARGVPSPRGGDHWSASTVRRVLRAVGQQPQHTATGRARSVSPAQPLSGLVRCHCGGLLTGQRRFNNYYCSRGRDMSAAAHGPLTVPHHRLEAVLRDEAAKYRPEWQVRFAGNDLDAGERARLEQRRQSLGDLVLDGLLTRERAKAEADQIDARLADMVEQERQIASLGLPEPLDWDAPVEDLNKALRALWSRIDLNPDMTVKQVVWAVPARYYDEAAAEAYERGVTEAA